MKHSTPHPEANIFEPRPAESKLASFAESMAGFAKSGFAIASKDVVEQREKVCKSCPMWEPLKMVGTGRCRKCGCSTWAKLRIASEKCPLGKW